MSEHTDLGRLGERLCWQWLHTQWGEVLPSTTGADMSVGGRQIEVKTARAGLHGRRRRYQFCLRKARHTDCGHSDYVVCIGMGDGAPEVYVIPVELLAGRQKLTIHAGGDWRWATWRNRFDLLQ